jgi:hypothetical protein
VKDINRRLPGNVTVTAVFDQIDALLKPAATPAGARQP